MSVALVKGQPNAPDPNYCFLETTFANFICEKGKLSNYRGILFQGPAGQFLPEELDKKDK